MPPAYWNDWFFWLGIVILDTLCRESVKSSNAHTDATKRNQLHG